MPDFFPIRKSVFGRTLAISSSGGIVSAVTSTGGFGSSDCGLSAQMWGPSLVQTIGAASTGTLVSNCGVTQFTTGSSAAAAYTIDSPVKGVRKTLIFNLVSTAIYLNTGAANTIFHISSGHTSSTLGSTVIAVKSSDGVYTACDMVGLSTLSWYVTNLKTTHISTST